MAADHPGSGKCRIAKLGRSKHFAIATTIVIAIIVYGSLYPFAFRPASEGIRPALRALLESWADRPSRIDFLANILLYVPFGFFAIQALGRWGGTGRGQRSNRRCCSAGGRPDTLTCVRICEILIAIFIHH